MDYREILVELKNGEKFAYEGKIIPRSIFDMKAGYQVALSYRKDEHFLYVNQYYEDGEHFTYAFNLSEVVTYTEKTCASPKEE